MVLSWYSWNWPLTKRSTRLDLPTADSPSKTSLNWHILFPTGAAPLVRAGPPRPAMPTGRTTGEERADWIWEGSWTRINGAQRRMGSRVRTRKRKWEKEGDGLYWMNKPREKEKRRRLINKTQITRYKCYIVKHWTVTLSGWVNGKDRLITGR